MQIIGLFVYNHLRKIHRGTTTEFACGHREMVRSGTKIQALAAINIPIEAPLSLLCGSCWNTRNTRVLINPNENRILK